MIDITHKNSTKRTATAQATVLVSQQATIEAVQQGKVPKGDVLEASRIAALFGVKRTADLIPDCHPMPVEFTSVEHEIEGMEIRIDVSVGTVYKTGVEVEAMHGASIAALTMYDMLKPIDKGIEIRSIKLLQKRGGKSSFKEGLDRPIKAAVLVVSDSVSAGKKEDKAGKAIMAKLESLGVELTRSDVVPDEVDQIRSAVQGYLDEKIDLIISTGGTGLGLRDHTPEALRPLIEKEVPGIMEAARNFGQDRTPYAMLARGAAGMNGDSLILALPGSTKGAQESMDALFPALLHIFRVRDIAYRHEQ